MRVSLAEIAFRGNDHNCLSIFSSLIVGICALMALGCEEETRNLGKRPETRALDQTGVSVGLDENPRPQAQPQVHVRSQAKQSGPIIGQRTTDIRDANKERKQGGAQVAWTRIVAKDPITLHGNAYVSIIGQTSVNAIKHNMDLYYATNERYPKDFDEFMSEIIKPQRISLPQLPPYQKYGYDEKEHKLIILEYPDLKN